MPSWKDVHDTNGAIRYKLTNEGESYEHPAACDDVFLKFKGTDTNGNILQQQDEVGVVRFGEGVLPCGVEKAISEYFYKGSTGMVEVDAGPYCGHLQGTDVERAQGAVHYEVIALAKVEVRNWNSIHDIFGDGGIVVTCVTDAEGYQRPGDGTQCTFEIEGSYADGSVFQEHAELSISIGEETCCLAIEEALKFVKQCSFSLNMLDLKSTFSMGWDERFEGATKRKALGNGAVKDQNWERALEKYDAAFRLIDHTNELDREKRGHEDALKMSLHLNRSLVHQKLRRHEQCIDECDKALAIDSCNTKALFRQATAQMEIGQLGKAQASFEKVKELDPTLKEADRQLAKLQKKHKQLDKKDKALFARMMSTVGERGDEDNPFGTSEAAKTGASLVEKHKLVEKDLDIARGENEDLKDTLKKMKAELAAKNELAQQQLAATGATL